MLLLRIVRQNLLLLLLTLLGIGIFGIISFGLLVYSVVPLSLSKIGLFKINSALSQDSLPSTQFYIEHCRCSRHLTISALTEDHMDALYRADLQQPSQLTNCISSHLNLETNQKRASFMEKGNDLAIGCGLDASRRGFDQKVISFSISREDNELIEKLEGLKENVNLAAKHYPSWTLRLYHNLNSSMTDTLCTLACKNPGLDLCDVTRLQDNPVRNLSDVPASLWKFLVGLDYQVSSFMTRNLDSRITDREVNAVKKWLASKKSVHIMRDHPDQSAPVIPGNFGSHVGQRLIRSLWKASWRNMLRSSLIKSNDSSVDLHLLRVHIWPWAEHDSLQHDSYHCHSTYFGTRSFPTPRENEENNYVGVKVAEKVTLKTPCPVKCRGKLGWEYC